MTIVDINHPSVGEEATQVPLQASDEIRYSSMEMIEWHVQVLLYAGIL